MRAVFSLLLLLVSVNSFAVEINIYHPCSKTKVIQRHLPVSSRTTVAAFTIKSLQALKVRHVAERGQLKSIFGTPTGMEAIDVYSDKKMLSFGWCYKLNEKLVMVPAGSQVISHNNLRVTWFYGSAAYDAGKWLDMCVPSFQRMPRHFCHGKRL